MMWDRNMSNQLRVLLQNGTTIPGNFTAHSSRHIALSCLVTTRLCRCLRVADIVDRVAVFLQEKVMHTQGQLVVTYGRVCESKGLTSDHYSDTVSQRLWFFTVKASHILTSQEMDACLLQVPIMKHHESTAVYLHSLLNWLKEKTGVHTRSCAKVVRDSIDHAVKFHSNLPLDKQQCPGGTLRFCQGPCYLYKNMTEEVIQSIIDFRPGIGLSEYHLMPDKICSRDVAIITTRIQKSLLKWKQSLKGLQLKQICNHKALQIKMAGYSTGWICRRYPYLYELWVDPAQSTWFEIGMSPQNTAEDGEVVFGGVGVLKLPLKMVSKKKPTVPVKNILLRLMLRGLSRITFQEFIRTHDVKHRHVGDFSMLACLFGGFIVDDVIQMRSRKQTSKYCEERGNMRGSKNTIKSDEPKWFVCLYN